MNNVQFIYKEENGRDFSSAESSQQGDAREICHSPTTTAFEDVGFSITKCTFFIENHIL